METKMGDRALSHQIQANGSNIYLVYDLKYNKGQNVTKRLAPRRRTQFRE